MKIFDDRIKRLKLLQDTTSTLMNHEPYSNHEKMRNCFASAIDIIEDMRSYIEQMENIINSNTQEKIAQARITPPQMVIPIPNWRTDDAENR